MNKIAIIGAGAFGTSLACTLGRAGSNITLWGRDVEALKETRVNSQYLPDVEIPDTVKITNSLLDLKEAQTILLVTPAQQIRTVLSDIKDYVGSSTLVLCSKGIDASSGLLQSDIASEYIQRDKLAILSGPSFADDIGLGKPTALTLAAFDQALGENLQHQLSTQALRLYLSLDPKGVQIGGALKNVIAIAAGLVDGASLGESARAALITRGFSEMKTVASKLGAESETLNGLSGLGDLTLTCSSTKSRNYRYGRDVAIKGAHSPDKTVEGIATAQAAYDLSKLNELQTPIIDAVQNVVMGKMDVAAALKSLMTRPLKTE